MSKKNVKKNNQQAEKPAAAPSSQLELGDAVYVDYDEAKHGELVENYTLITPKGEESIRRNLTLLIDRLMELEEGTQVSAKIHRHIPGESPQLATYVLDEGKSELVAAKLRGALVPAEEIIKSLMGNAMQFSEFSDLSSVMITAVFTEQGVCGSTYANPTLPLTEEGANKIYEAGKSHVANYKDNVKKKFGFTFGDDSNIILPGGGKKDLII